MNILKIEQSNQTLCFIYFDKGLQQKEPPTPTPHPTQTQTFEIAFSCNFRFDLSICVQTFYRMNAPFFSHLKIQFGYLS